MSSTRPGPGGAGPGTPLLDALPTEYEVIDGCLTGYCVSPLGPDFDEFGDLAPADIAAVRVLGLPPRA